jgi:hypothetical protein
LREIFGRHAFEPNSQEICVLITINPTISGTLWNVTDRKGFNYAGGGESAQTAKQSQFDGPIPRNLANVG